MAGSVSPTRSAAGTTRSRPETTSKEVDNTTESQKIKLKITTPAGVYEGVFAETDTVDEVIAIVVKEKQLAEGDAFDLTLDGGDPLPGDTKLWELGLEDGAVLDLIASGSAV